MKTKICTKCEQAKPLDDFEYKHKNSFEFRSWCKPCEREAARLRMARLRTDPNFREKEKARLEALYRLKERYPDEYQQIVQEALEDRQVARGFKGQGSRQIRVTR